jgi:protein-L-isoaspartate(D-aspartate) O-methyltransferase
MSDFSTARQKMVDGQVRTSDVTDPRIIDAMLELPREAFVPEDKRALAYLDLDLDVAVPPAPKRYLLKPMLTARLLQAAAIEDADNVLIVGCATGYAAAIAARIAAKVAATEMDPVLVAKGNEILGQIGITNVTFREAAAVAGDPAGVPFDVIILNGATEVPLQRLYQQLATGGRLVGVFAISDPPRAKFVTRSQNDFGYRILFDATAPVLPGLRRVPEFVF